MHVCINYSCLYLSGKYPYFLITCLCQIANILGSMSSPRFSLWGPRQGYILVVMHLCVQRHIYGGAFEGKALALPDSSLPPNVAWVAQRRQRMWRWGGQWQQASR